MRQVSQEEAVALLDELNAVWEGHFIGAELKHLSGYVQKDVPTTYPVQLRTFAEGIAWLVRDIPVDVIASPELGAIALGSRVAEELGVRFVIIEKAGLKGMDIGRTTFIEAVRGQRVGLVEDIVSRGKTSRDSRAAVEATGGAVAYATALYSRSGETAETLQVPVFRPLVNRMLQDWPDQYSCQLCRDGVPIVLDVGHAREFKEKNPEFEIEYITRR